MLILFFYLGFHTIFARFYMFYQARYAEMSAKLSHETLINRILESQITINHEKNDNTLRSRAQFSPFFIRCLVGLYIFHCL
jgi:hypothetical protein